MAVTSYIHHPYTVRYTRPKHNINIARMATFMQTQKKTNFLVHVIDFHYMVIALRGAIQWLPNSQRNDHQNTFLMKYLDNILSRWSGSSVYVYRNEPTLCVQCFVTNVTYLILFICVNPVGTFYLFFFCIPIYILRHSMSMALIWSYGDLVNPRQIKSMFWKVYCLKAN